MTEYWKDKKAKVLLNEIDRVHKKEYKDILKLRIQAYELREKIRLKLLKRRVETIKNISVKKEGTTEKPDIKYKIPIKLEQIGQGYKWKVTIHEREIMTKWSVIKTHFTNKHKERVIFSEGLSFLVGVNKLKKDETEKFITKDTENDYFKEKEFLNLLKDLKISDYKKLWTEIRFTEDL